MDNLDIVLGQIKDKVRAKIPAQDNRSTISPLELIFGLIQAVFTAKRDYSIADLRRSVITFTGINIVRSSFLDRLKTKYIVDKMYFVLKVVMKEFTKINQEGNTHNIDILEKIGVTSMVAVDSSIVTLWDSLALKFPGTFNYASVKLHACIDLMTGAVDWYKHTPGSTHDSQCFPTLRASQGKLFIFDLGYWSYELLVKISNKGAFFLSRIKTSASLVIKETVSGIGKKHVGSDLLSLNFKKSRGKIIEAIVQVVVDGKSHSYRAVGFWNSTEKCYHWYITNLKCEMKYIYLLYKLRWQVELSFKACKSTINIDNMPTTHPYAVLTLLLVGLINYQISIIIGNIGRKNSKKKSLLDQFSEQQRSADTLFLQSQGISLRILKKL